MSLSVRLTAYVSPPYLSPAAPGHTARMSVEPIDEPDDKPYTRRERVAATIIVAVLVVAAILLLT